MDDELFDYVIVGAGSAGSVLAARLTEDPAVRVALVEAGGPDTDPAIRVPGASLALLGTELDWGYATVPQPGLGGRSVDWPRGKVLGGSSSLNFQMWIPGSADDYDAWGRTAGPTWSWQTVRPHLRTAERWAGAPAEGTSYGDDGPLWISPPRDPDPTTAHFLRACADLGLGPIPGGLGGPHLNGSALTPLNQRNGTRWSSADGYLRPALERANLTLFTRQQARRIVLENNRARGVELADVRLMARREVILSAGAVGSPHLLMLSGIGDERELAAAGVEPRVHLPGVGRNLHDHATLDVIRHAVSPVRLADAESAHALKQFEEDRVGPLTSNIAEAVGFLRSDGRPGPPDLEVIWAPIAFQGDALADGLTIGVVLLQPESRGTVSLQTPDPDTPPLIDPQYLSAPVDLHRLAAGARFAERLFATDALRPLVGEAMSPWTDDMSDEALLQHIRDHTGTLFHPVGTCRMGLPDDDAAVVDPDMRVRQVHGLRIVDASVFPRITRGHTHAPAVMLAERAASQIREATSG
ncbi:putative GMC-type oxidoreductase [Streptomyces spinoverrucosus]|uniref:Putative GMC-type oxidoreductase n=1 Tax=Streptomyces spinoverrucosus TaxID=284043 RepID=A0A4Y3VMM1_9ACTN|nr:GMC family oxidoreductase N-terminal domain-containing protein [Streptomyces spinoverrucosus]GEC08097.1 putative GMC-type oxidoreductase [Streptomyces spinoverrucosus]GHB64817.1 putative GMC-type oxidoreductase [Streptomyces spinoverrucosus]